MPDESVPLPTGQQALETLYAALNSKLDTLADAATISAVEAERDHVYDVLTKLNQQSMQAHTGPMQAAAASVQDGLKNLDALKQSIDNISDQMKSVATVLADVATLVNGIAADAAIV